MIRDVLFVMVGGAIGSALRFLLSHSIGYVADRLPLATLVVNILGSFALGLLSGVAYRSDLLSRSALLLLGTGVCGGFSTMSAFSVETLNLLHIGEIGRMVVYVFSTLFGCTAAAYAGIIIGRSFTWT